MISFASIWAVVLRHTRVWRHDLNPLLASFYWPLLDIMMWGFLGAWIAQSGNSELHNYQSVALLAVLLWQVVGRGSNFMVSSFTEELYANNIVNLFTLPLRISEWMCGIVLFYVIGISITSLICIGAISVFFDLSVGHLLSTFFIFLPPLFFSCIWIGFSCLSIVVAWGKRSVELAWVISWFLMPFSGAYYPVEVLPAWAQNVSSYIPFAYVFQGMRGYVMHDQDPTPYLVKAYVLSVLYAACAVVLFIYCFNRSKKNGLARLAD